MASPFNRGPIVVVSGLLLLVSCASGQENLLYSDDATSPAETTASFAPAPAETSADSERDDSKPPAESVDLGPAREAADTAVDAALEEADDDALAWRGELSDQPSYRE
ncbi:MAG: hypothetical protein ACOCV2_07200, partial [Persicimonas sp.]